MSDTIFPLFLHTFQLNTTKIYLPRVLVDTHHTFWLTDSAETGILSGRSLVRSLK